MYNKNSNITYISFDHRPGTADNDFTYDALGRRIQVKDALADADEKYKRFYYDGQRVLLETGINDVLAAGSETDDRYYVFGNYIDEVLVMNDGTDDHYYGHDHLFSAVVLFDSTGTVEERYEYDAYGKCAVLDADLTADADGLSDFGNPYTFTGRRLDVFDSGNYEIMYYRARYYDTNTGRFLTQDPLGVNPTGGKVNPFNIAGQYTDGMSLYEYVRSNPISFNDPLGSYLRGVFDQNLSRSWLPWHRGHVSYAHVELEFECKKIWYSRCKHKLKLKVWFFAFLDILKYSHEEWDRHYPRYDDKWGKPRPNRIEWKAAYNHELDHYRTYNAYWHSTVKAASPFDGKTCRSKTACTNMGNCVTNKIAVFFLSEAQPHSRAFDRDPRWVGGEYKKYPFNKTLDLSSCK